MVHFSRSLDNDCFVFLCTIENFFKKDGANTYFVNSRDYYTF